MKALAGPSLVILAGPCCGLSLIREDTGPCQEGLLPLLQVLTVCCPCCETEASSAWRHQLLPVYQIWSPYFFSAWHVLLSFHWENAKARQYCHSLSHGKDAVKPPTAHTMPLTPKANQEWFYPNIHTKRLSLQYFRQTLWPACSSLIIWGLGHVTSHCSLSKGTISLGKQNIEDQAAQMLLGYPS